MKIVRHIAPDMRQAMRSIREQLGDDAVILSSRRIPEGVEVTAAVDFDATSLQGAMNAPAGTLTAAPLPTQPAAASRVLASSRTAPAPTPAPAPAPSYSHAATSHYFPAAPAADALPFAHILSQDTATISAPAYAPASAAPAGGSFADRSVAGRSVPRGSRHRLTRAGMRNLATNTAHGGGNGAIHQCGIATHARCCI
jgi:flagellar biosynthesis protein FlhF